MGTASHFHSQPYRCQYPTHVGDSFLTTGTPPTLPEPRLRPALHTSPLVCRISGPKSDEIPDVEKNVLCTPVIRVASSPKEYRCLC